MNKTSYNKRNRSSQTRTTRFSHGDKSKNVTGNSTVKPPILPQKKIKEVDNSKKANRYFVLFFFVFSLILYGNTVLNKWAVDDIYVTGPQNELVKKGFAAIPQIFSSHYVDTKGNVGSQQTDYRPIVKVTFAIEYGIWGKFKPGISHGINVLLYFFIITLLFFILKRLLRNYNILFPFLITLLFMAHPVHTEVVASLKNRDELISFLCGLGGLHFFLRFADKKKIIYVFAALILFIIGYLSKSSIIPFVAIYPLVLYFFTDMKPKNFIWIFGMIFVAGLLSYYIPHIFLPKAVHVSSYIENPLFVVKHFWIRTGTALMTLLFYLRLLIFPHPLVYYYGFNMMPITNWGNLLVIISFIIHLGLFIYALLKFKEKHILSFAILYYYFAISIFSNIGTPVVGIVGERFAFSASLGFIIALVYIIFIVFRTDPKSLTIEFNERAKIIVIIILLLIPCTAMTITRNREWRNLTDLYESDIKYQENSVKANIDYAEYWRERVYTDPGFQQNGAVNERLQRIIVSHFRKALSMYPDDYKTLNDLAAVYIEFTPKADSGLVFLKKAIALRPELQPGWVNLAMAYTKTNKLDSAIICYQKVLQINPGALVAVFKMADIYFQKGNLGKAIKINEDVMKRYPDMDVPYFNIGYYYIMQGDTTIATNYFEQAAQRNPTFEVCTNLSMIFKAKKDMRKANYYHELAGEAAQRESTAKPTDNF